MENLNAGTEVAVRGMRQKLSVLCKTRAAVNCEQPDYCGLALDPLKKHFSVCLLPFRDHQSWRVAPSDLLEKCLSYAWAIYNLKTIYIECDVVTLACEDIIKTPPSSANRALLQDVMSEALLDEALHTRMSIMACNYVYDMRKIQPLDFAGFNLVRWREGILGGIGVTRPIALLRELATSCRRGKRVPEVVLLLYVPRIADIPFLDELLELDLTTSWLTLQVFVTREAVNPNDCFIPGGPDSDDLSILKRPQAAVICKIHSFAQSLRTKLGEHFPDTLLLIESFTPPALYALATHGRHRPDHQGSTRCQLTGNPGGQRRSYSQSVPLWHLRKLPGEDRRRRVSLRTGFLPQRTRQACRLRLGVLHVPAVR